MSAPTCESVRADLEYLSDAWPYIVTLRIPGTPRAWVETPRRGVIRDADPERTGKRGVPRQAPPDVGVLDLLHQFAKVADDVGRTVLDVAELGEEFEPTSSSFRDPRPWLLSTKTWLEQAQQRDPRTVPWVHDQLKPLCSAAAHLLGDVRAGQVMNGICPWCRGLGENGRATAERTLQIHYPNLEKTDDEPLIVCMGMCSPPSSACGMRWRGHPAWPQREWDWLSKQLLDPNNLSAGVR